jgi:pimeloyl-ACP methyl ester carboxylesterase
MFRRSPFALLLLACLGCTAAENRLLYHPVRSDPRNYRPPPPPLQDVYLNLADGTKIHARWCPHPGARGALLFCHGNAGNLEGWGRAARELWEALGESVLIFDYPGYGYSDGSPSEAGCYAAADAAYRWLTENQGIPAGRVILYGESLGGGVAVELASRRPHRALVLVRTFTSVPDVARAQVSSVAPPLMTNRFDSLARIGLCRRPIFLAAADRDRVVPFAQGERLHAACADRAEFYRLRGLGHNDPLPADFYERLRAFLEGRAPAPAGTEAGK